MRISCVQLITTIALLFSACISASEMTDLTEQNYNVGGKEKGIVLLHINWGRQWKCAGLDNAQIESLAFTHLPLGQEPKTMIALETPSKLMVKNSFSAYALIVEPGDYAISAFDVKVAKSSSDVGHLIGDESKLFKEGNPIGGTFTVGAAEVVYIGHFGLDCSKEPIPWRYYVESKSEFQSYIAGFHKTFPYVKDSEVTFRLFSTTIYGQPFSLEQ